MKIAVTPVVPTPFVPLSEGPVVGVGGELVELVRRGHAEDALEAARVVRELVVVVALML